MTELSLTVKVVLIVVFAFVIGHLLRRFTAKFATLSAAEYMIVGLIIGPHVPYLGLGVLSRADLTDLAPLFSLLLGLIGFLTGIRKNRTLQAAGMAGAAFSSSLLLLVTFAVLTLPLLDRLFPAVAQASDFEIDHALWRLEGMDLAIHIDSNTLWLALGLSACATVSSAGAIKTFRDGRPGRVGDFLQGSARASQIMGIVVLGLVLAATRATSQANRFSMTVVEWSVAAGLLGVLCGFLFAWFIGRENDPSRVFLAAVGLVVFASGVGAALGISPLFVNLLAGIIVANTSPHSERVREPLERLEQPLFVLVLVFAGAMFVPPVGWQWLLLIVYPFLRWILRRVFARIAGHGLVEPRLATRRLGNGLLSHGTLAVAIAFSLALRFPAWAGAVLSTVLFGVLVSDVFSRRALRGVLIDAGEIGFVGDESAADDEAKGAGP